MQFADKKESAWIKPEMGHHSIAIVGLIASPPQSAGEQVESVWIGLSLQDSKDYPTFSANYCCFMPIFHVLSPSFDEMAVLCWLMLPSSLPFRK